jgi:hypothetical protein
MASATLFLTENVDSQAKFDETTRRMEIIQQAILGDSTRRLNGETEISGFAADMGRAPDCIRELLEAVDCNGNSLAFWQQDVDSLLWSGWRGPYIQVTPELNANRRFRDGYGNTGANNNDDQENSGWQYANGQSGVTLSSEGFENTTDTDDFPPDGANNIVLPSDIQTYFGEEWQNIDVTFVNTGSEEARIPVNSLRVRFNYPTNGLVLGYGDDELNTAAERNLSAYLSGTFPSITAISPAFPTTTAASIDNLLLPSVSGFINVNTGDKLEFAPAADVSGALVTLNQGTEVSLNQSGEINYFRLSATCDPCTLNVPDSYVISATPDLTFLVSGAISVLPSIIEPIEAPNLAKSIFTVPEGSSIAGTTLTLPSTSASITLPAGSSDIINNQVVLGPSSNTITVSESFTTLPTSYGQLITTNTSGDTFIVPHNATFLGNVITIPAGMIVPNGPRSLTVICETSGQRFDGFDTNNTVSTVDDACVTEDAPLRANNINLIARTKTPASADYLQWEITQQ